MSTHALPRIPTPAAKVCRRCNAEKPAVKFQKTTDSADGRKHICRRCLNGRWAKHGERVRAAIRVGKAVPRVQSAWFAESRERRAAARTRSAAQRAARSQQRWIDLLKHEMPELYDQSLGRNTLVWRARYHLDAEFKTREIGRLHAKKTKDAHDRELTDDGSLTPPVLRALFAAAKRCLYCGHPMRATDKTLDHVTPRVAGGIHGATNVVVCCKRCNARKGGRSPTQWLARLSEARREVVRRAWHAMCGLNIMGPSTSGETAGDREGTSAAISTPHKIVVAVAGR
jgi:5-methylcytosine-specific restriction endonuclease McrA